MMREEQAKMKAVIIGASSEALHTIEKAHGAGLFVTALDGNPDAEGLREADRGLVVDISDENAVTEAVRADRKSTRLNSSHP